MLARDIYKFHEPYGLSIEQKVVLAAKRLSVLFAAAAMTFGALDIIGIRSMENVRSVLFSARGKAVAFAETVRNGDISFRGAIEEVRVMIPRTAWRLPGKSPPTVLADLADTGKQDAIELAMVAPVQTASAMPMSTAPRGLAARAEAPLPEPKFAEPKLAERPTLDLPRIEPAPIAPMRIEPPRADNKPVLASLPMPALDSPGPLASAKSEPAWPSTSSPVTAALPMGEPAFPLGAVPLPRPAPGAPSPSPAELLGLKGKEHEKEYARAERCLANAIYFEARGEPVRGQEAVAQVVINRAFSGFYPNDVCDVVYQNANRHLACQFTFACDGKRKIINERAQWARANKIAKQTLDGVIYVPEVGKSTHYHAAYVHPNWVREMRKVFRFGIHSFYRPWAWGNGADEPAWGTASMAQATKKASAKN